MIIWESQVGCCWRPTWSAWMSRRRYTPSCWPKLVPSIGSHRSNSHQRCLESYPSWSMMGEDKDASPYPLQIPTSLLNGRFQVATAPRHVGAGFAPLEHL